MITISPKREVERAAETFKTLLLMQNWTTTANREFLCQDSYSSTKSKSA